MSDWPTHAINANAACRAEKEVLTVIAIEQEIYRSYHPR
jgi:hypothetical protein